MYSCYHTDKKNRQIRSQVFKGKSNIIDEDCCEEGNMNCHVKFQCENLRDERRKKKNRVQSPWFQIQENRISKISKPFFRKR